MDSAQNIFSYCVGGLALVSTILSVLSYCRRYLPTTQLRRLDDLLVETKNIYRKANDEDLLPTDVSTYAHMTLTIYEDESDKLREVAYRARSRLETLRSLFLGHTRRIMCLVEEVSDLRSLLMTVSQNEKARKARETQTSGVVLSSQMDETSDTSTTPCIDNAHGGFGLPSDSCTLVSQDPPRGSMGTDQPTNDCSFPDPPAAPFPSPLDHIRRTSTCFVCSLSGWWTRESSVAQISLPTSAVPVEDQRPSILNSSVSSRSSTLVDELPQKSTERRWFLLINRVSIYVCTFFGRRTYKDQQPNPDDIPLPRRDCTTTSPV